MDTHSNSREVVARTWERLLPHLHQNADVRYYLTGGLAVRVWKAAKEGRRLTAESLREHSDIDIIVFEEDLVPFLMRFPHDAYLIWHAAIAGAEQQVEYEYHHVSLKDRETHVNIGLFIAQAAAGGRRVPTNRSTWFHPDAAFDVPPVSMDGGLVRAISPEWLYYHYLFTVGEKKMDTDLLAPMVDFRLLHEVQKRTYFLPANRFDYHLWLLKTDERLSAAGVFTPFQTERTPSMAKG